MLGGRLGAVRWGVFGVFGEFWVVRWGVLGVFQGGVR